MKAKKGSAPCPVAGCSAVVSKSSLEEDEDMIYELRRAERRKEIQSSQRLPEQSTQDCTNL